jgi:hypothetical protein
MLPSRPRSPSIRNAVNMVRDMPALACTGAKVTARHALRDAAALAPRWAKTATGAEIDAAIAVIEQPE